jgi:tRNA(Ile)-lysidine synthase
LERVWQTILRHRMLDRGQCIGVAVSGGADSVCLLHVLRELAPRLDCHLLVLHLDHRLRGAESSADAAFVSAMARELGLPFLLREANLGGGDNLEQAARRARMAFFSETIASGAAGRVAVGHTRSDQAETVLYRFLRGSGTAGLAGIRPVVAPGVVRPLFEIERPEIEGWLRARGIAWREDSSNASPLFARNRIRHGLLPELRRDWNPALPEILAHTATWAREEEDYWAVEIARLSERLFEERAGEIRVRAAAIAQLPTAVARRLVRHAIERVRGDLRSIDFRHIASVMELIGPGRGEGRTVLPGMEVRRSLDWIRFARPSAVVPYRFAVTAPCTLAIPGTDSEVSLELIEKSETFAVSDNVYNDVMGCLDWGRLSGALELRSWRPGDQYQPVGSTGDKKIKTLFQQARIPVWERSSWPVLLDQSNLVWTRRFGPAATCAAGDRTRVLLKIRETERS